MSVDINRKFCANPSGTVECYGGPSIRWHTSSFDGSTQPYACYLPADYDPSRAWPLVISLHGHSSDHVLNMRRVLGRGNSPDEPDCQAKACFPKLPEVEFIIASPYGFGSIGYETAAERDVLDVLEDVQSGFNVDPNRIYLTGLSMGGAGTWSIATRHPDLFAAIAPVCPPFDYRKFAVGRGPVAEFEHQVCDGFSAYTHLKNLESVPAKVFHGIDDPVVPVEHSRKMVACALELGCQVDYVEYPGVGHNAWDPAYRDAAIFSWFEQFKRVEKPAIVEFTTPSLRWPTSYWVRIDQIETRPKIARIHAEVTDGPAISVESENVSAFTLLLAQSPLSAGEPLTITWNGDELYRGIPMGPVISFGESGAGLTKHAGLEGPVPDVFRDKYVLVYGSSDDGTGVRDAAQEAAKQMACLDEWADIDIPVKADREVTGDDIAGCNLVLFGSPETNSLIEKVNDGLPVRFGTVGLVSGRREVPSADGMLLVYPNPLNQERLVMIVGGRSPGTVTTAASNYRYAPDYVVLGPDSDFSNPDTILDWGWFDSNWKLGF